MGLDARWRSAAVAALRLPSAGRWLDVGAGPGDMLRLSGQPNLRKVGLDPEPAMLLLLKSARPLPGLPVMAVAEAMPFQAETFDAISAAFAVRNFGDRREALAQFNRVIKPVGRGAIVEFSPPPATIVGILARIYVKTVIPLIGGLISGDFGAYSYLARTIMKFPAPQEFSEELRAAGFSVVQWRRLNGGVAVLYVFSRHDGAV